MAVGESVTAPQARGPGPARDPGLLGKTSSPALLDDVRGTVRGVMNK